MQMPEIFMFLEEPNNGLEGSIAVVLMTSAVVFIIFMVLRNKDKTKNTSHFQTALSRSSSASYDKIRNELEELFVQIEEAASSYVAKLDTKIKLAQGLLSEIEKQKAELQAALSQIQRTKAGTAAKDDLDAVAGAEMSDVKPANPLHRRVFELRKQNRTTREIAREVGLTEGEVELILGITDLGK